MFHNHRLGPGVLWLDVEKCLFCFYILLTNFYIYKSTEEILPVNILILRERRRRRLRNFNIERIHMRNTYDAFNLDDIEFKRRFRLTKALVHQLITELAPYMNVHLRENTLDPQTRVLVALSFYATGSYQRLIGQSHNISISQQSVSNCIREVSLLLTIHLRDAHIKFPQTDVEIMATKLGFHQKWHFPGVVGAIDCTHIKLLCPANEEHNYVNRKGYHSKNVQIICDSDLKILAVNPRHAGATHDTYIWRTSLIQQEMERRYRTGERGSWLIGDSGYPLQPWLMTPTPNADPNTPEGRYNSAHCSARNCIERCNGVLKQRFRCVSGERTLRYSPEVVGQIVTACAVLHNMCIVNHLNIDLDVQPILLPPQFRYNEVDNNLFNEGNRVRQQIINRYFT